MLNGIDPIIIFEFAKLTKAQEEKVSKIPVVSSIVSTIGLPPIPIYLSEKITGLYIDTEERNIDIDTTVETLVTGSDPLFNQKAINSVVRISMHATKDSLGLTLLSALTDLVVPKVSSKEYSITYLHGAITIFSGLLHSFGVSQSANNDLLNITLELVKVPKKITVDVTPSSKAVPLASDNPATAAPTASMGGAGLPPPPPAPAPAAPAPVQLKGPR
jgi:cytochrome c biogenesis protein CcdA